MLLRGLTLSESDGDLEVIQYFHWHHKFWNEISVYLADVLKCRLAAELLVFFLMYSRRTSSARKGYAIMISSVLVDVSSFFFIWAHLNSQVKSIGNLLFTFYIIEHLRHFKPIGVLASFSWI